MPPSSIMAHSFFSPPNRFWECSENLLELFRTSSNPYKLQFFSSPSDLMKSTVVDESLSTNATRVLFQRKTTSLLHTSMSLNKYGCHIANMSFRAIWLHEHIDLALIYPNTVNCNSYFTHYCHICARNKYAPQLTNICHIYQLLCMQMGDNNVSIYASYEITAIKASTKLLLYIHFTLLVYAPQMPQIWQNQNYPTGIYGGKYANTYVTHEVVPFNDVAGISAGQLCHRLITYTELATWPNLLKKRETVRRVLIKSCKHLYNCLIIRNAIVSL